MFGHEGWIQLGKLWIGFRVVVPSDSSGISNIYLEMPANAMLCRSGQNTFALPQIYGHMVSMNRRMGQQRLYGGQALLCRELFQRWHFNVRIFAEHVGYIIRGYTIKIGQGADSRIFSQLHRGNRCVGPRFCHPLRYRDHRSSFPIRCNMQIP